MGSSGTSKLGPKDKEVNLGFGFNNIEFSDWILRLEIIPDQDDNDSECGNDFKVQTLHINSLLFAAKSPFFSKLFNNGMKESQDKDDVTLRITASEEAAFIDLLKFIYGEPLSASSAPELVHVLMAADKFEVASCMGHCSNLLLKLPMTTKSAVFYVELASTVFVGEVVEPLIESAKQYLAGFAAHYRDFTKSKQVTAMRLPLYAIEIVLGSDGLQVDSEDEVFDFILKWARKHYPKLGERREVLTKHLLQFICLANMSRLKLKEAMVDCPDFDREELSDLVVNAFHSKDQVLFTGTKPNFPRRVYNYRLVKVLQLEFVQPRCVVFFDLRKEECADLLSSKRIYSQTFCLGGKYLFLCAQCTEKHPNFGLSVKSTDTSESCSLDFEFAVAMKSSKNYTRLAKSNFNVAADNGRGFLFRTPWNKFMGDGSEYFVDGILHMRAELTFIDQLCGLSLV